MTVIIGHKMQNKIYLGADNRTSTVDDTLVSDDVKKIVVVNDKVAVAFAGISWVQLMFEKMTKDSDNNFRVEDALRCIKIIYWICKIPWYKKYTKNILTYGSRVIVAGKNKKNEYCIYTMSIIDGKREKPVLTEHFMFPPSDISAEECYNVYAKNVLNYQDDFIKRTIKDIGKMSNVVSTSGDIWMCDIITGKSTLEHFS